MTARSALRGLGYVASELFDALWPAQAVRCALGRDYSRAVTAAAAEFDAEEGLNEFEEANEVHEPRAQCRWCGNADTPGHACGRKYHEGLSSAASAGTGGSPVGVESPAPPAGVDPPSRTSPKGGGEGPAGDRGIRSSAPAGQPSFTDWATPVIAGVLERHRYRGYNVLRCGCYDPDILDRWEWEDHAAELIARRIEAALTREGKHVIVTSIYPMESGQDIGASMACEFFPQYQQK